MKDYQRQGMKAWLALDEKGGKHNLVPVHHQAIEYIEHYLQKSGVAEARDSPLFRSLIHRGTQLSGRATPRECVSHDSATCRRGWYRLPFVSRDGHHEFFGERPHARNGGAHCQSCVDRDDAAI